jgi:hypothetical protein
LRTGTWTLRPTTITIFLHDTIETKDLKKEDVPGLKARIKETIARPVEAWLQEGSEQESRAPAEVTR